MQEIAVHGSVKWSIKQVLFNLFTRIVVKHQRTVTVTSRVHSMLEKSLKMLEFGIKTSWPLKVLENR